MVRHARLLLLVCFAVALLPVMAACDQTPEVVITSPDHQQLAVVKVEIAATTETRELGLMYRNHLDENAGMIFVFPSPESAQFWMKNTIVPLDMLFADSNGKVLGIVANAQPYSEALLGGFGGTLYVLEVNAGYAAQHHVVDGDRLEFRGFNPHTSR